MTLGASFAPPPASAVSAEAAAKPALVVDMDGTLVRTDTLHEALFSLASSSPGALLGLIGPLREGKPAFKRAVADRRIADAEALPLDEDVVEIVRKARAEGRRTALVSASDHRQVEAVAARVGLFDEAHGTGGADVGDANLGGAAKADFLVRRFGEKGFDYVGDAKADVPVWAAARRAITVRGDEALRRAAEGANADVEHVGGGAARLKPYLKALRPHQWSKNMLVFMPMLAAHAMGAWPQAIAAFVAFSLTASSVYLINDLMDLAADRAHPRKRKRPFASGDIPLAHGVVLAPALVLVALILSALFTPPLFLAALAVYYIATFAYSFALKRRLIVDVCTLAGLYTMRLVAGAAAATVPLSPWILAFSMFLFLALAAVKRQAELTDQAKSGKAGASGRAYMVEDLPVLRGIALSAGNAAVLVLALYINSDAVAELYLRPETLWLICPLLLYWVSRIVMITHRGNMTDDPIVFAARDRISYAVVGISGAAILAAGP
ncbi:MAG: UbiA family prenyltransferase, partial [Pseudomonadota bacterium]